ncbi:MAG: CheR family methyltransferase [Cyanobacteria bacterium P01_E01_bin.6]
MSNLLAQHTQMMVHIAADGMLVQPNHIYVIPPNVQMAIAHGRLQLAACDQRQGRVKTIDAFFQALATDVGHRAIAIVLSGSNNDGATGIEAIRAAGGITIAQTPETSEFSEMPNAAIATRRVDFILPPAEIADELVTISRQPYLLDSASVDAHELSVVPENNQLLTVFRLLQQHTGVDFSHYKQTTFNRRLTRRMALHKLHHLSAYIQYLQDDPHEIQALYQDVLITVTRFFRDPEVYTAIKDHVLPLIVQQQDTPSIRIWVPGCATGEEVYSLAICLLEYCAPFMISPTIQIFGTDINDRTIEEARLGIYRESRLDGLSPEQLRRFFNEVEGGYQIRKSVRELCIFAKQDLGSDPPFSDIDLVSCRNVLIYFKSPLQQRILSIFHYSLKPTGFLVLGNAESVGDTSELFSVHDAQAKIYRRNAVPSRLNFDYITSTYPQEIVNQQPSFSGTWERSQLQQWADQIVLNRYAPVGVVVNEHLDILQFRGETSPYLRPAPGEPSFNLLKMIRPSLLVDLQTTLEQAKRQNVTVKHKKILREETHSKEVSLEVIPFSVSASQEGYFLVLFEQSIPSQALSESITEPSMSDESFSADSEIRRLQHELSTTRQELLDTQTFLQLTIEEQESTNQRLIIANEEILSSNEELKSTNEELQTAKEEIQSSNEELKTTNEELQRQHADAQRANDDLMNLLGNINIPILMLSNDLLIRRFTPVARGIFNLIPSDVGRPITDIRLGIDIPELESLILKVFETLESEEVEVQDRNGYWHLLRIRPYRTMDNHMSGVVLALVDINNLKTTLQQLAMARGYAESIVEMMPIPLLVLLPDLSIQTINRTFYETFQLSIEEALPKPLFELGNGEWNIPQLRSHLETLGGTHTQLRDIELEHTFEHLGDKILLLSASEIIHDDGTRMIILAVEDITERRRAEIDRLQLSQEQSARIAAEAEIDRLQLSQEQSARIAAEAANTSKDEFLSVLSHELRTPLTSILGWTELFMYSEIPEDDLNRAMEEIHHNVTDQIRLIDDLLDISRISQGRLSISPQSTNLVEVLEQSIARLSFQATEKNIQVTTDFDTTLDNLAVDPVRMVQVFTNLLSNAIKFTPNGGHITMSLTFSSSQVQVQVSDTGQGISPGFLPLIFERFRQADASIIRRETGLGLGLFIVRHLVEAHGGTVQAASPGRGQGSTFTVTLPRTSAEMASPLVPTSLSFEEISLKGVQVLLVEDNATNLRVFTLALESKDATVLAVSSAAAAMEILLGQPIDVIVSDIGMPHVSGLEFMQQVRSLPSDQGGQTPAIALTGYASGDDAQSSINAGFQCHLGKPIAIEDLVIAVYRLVQPVA